MVIFNMVKYNKKIYPSEIPIHIEEISAHFDVTDICHSMPYSLHTEYSYGERNFKNRFLKNYPDIIQANKNGIPQLWKDKIWARMFADFLIDLADKQGNPETVEIHPPFNDYIDNLKVFVEIYKVFEYRIKSKFPETKIQIENRCGSIYRDGKFLISNSDHIIELCQYIAKENLSLRIALDIPQVYTAHQVTPRSYSKITTILENLQGIRKYIGGVHLWGKTLSNGRRIAHCGTLDTYFNYDMQLKESFLKALHSLFSDSQIRNLVLEVNSKNQDLISIINDLSKAQFIYV